MTIKEQEIERLVEPIAGLMLEPLGYYGKTMVDAETIWVGNNIDTEETGSLAYLARSLARAALQSDALTALIKPLDASETRLIVKSERLAVAMSESWSTCQHEWEINGEGGDLGGNRTEVVCRLCRCPGDFADHSWEVVWPTT